MKKTLLALAALTAFAGVASAQSSVTLFGILDVNARNVSNDRGPGIGTMSKKSLSTDGIASSRLGFRGVEDIGGGVRASFWLEAGLSPDVGTAGGAGNGQVASATATTADAAGPAAFFNRRATVSLSGGFGEVRLGRDYTADFWNHTVYDPFGTNGVGSSINIYTPVGSGAATSVRADNAVSYFLPAMGGFFGQFQVAAGEGRPVSGARGNKHAAFRIGYAGGPVSVAVAYGQTDIEGVGPTTVADGDFKRLNFGASFNLGFMTLMGQYIKGEASGNSGFAANNREITNFVVGAAVPFGASTLKFSYVDSDGSGPAGYNPDAQQIAIGYQYDLSKRTAVYATGARITNKGTAAYSVATGTASPGNPAAGKNSTGYEFGVRHSF